MANKNERMREPAKRPDEDQGEGLRSRRGMGVTRAQVREIMKKNQKAMARLASAGGVQGGADTTVGLVRLARVNAPLRVGGARTRHSRGG